MRQKPNLLLLRPYIEPRLNTMGAVIRTCTESLIQFEGGLLEYRPPLVLARGTFEVTSVNDIACSVRISLWTVFLYLLAGSVALPLSYLAVFFMPIALACFTVAALILFAGWGHALNRLDELAEAVAADAMPQSGLPVEHPTLPNKT